eukprot:g16301.t1
MGVMLLTAEGVDLLERACAEDETPAVVEAICSCKSSADVRRVVQDRLLLDENKSPAAFGFGLARGIRRLRTGGQNRGNGHDGSDIYTLRRCLLRASASCVSKALQSSVGETAAALLHRGLRQPSLMLALLGVVQDNDTGSEAQRAAGSALVSFFDCSPGLWKELAKEVLASKALLEGFLEPASTLALISDHRTQELVFEAIYRLWKVWKKQEGGPPALPLSTPAEVKEALASIAAKDFEGQTRTMLASLNCSSSSRRSENGNAERCVRGEDEEEEEEEEDCWVAPPSSFPVEALFQATAWQGLGMSQRIGNGMWVDVNGDNIGIQVYPRASPGKFRGPAAPLSLPGGSGVFMSVSSETVKRSSKVLVAKRSLQLDVPFSECPTLAKLAHMPPGEVAESGRCTLILQLGGGARVFTQFRKAITALISATPPSGSVAAKTPKVVRGSKNAAVEGAKVEEEKSRFDTNTNTNINIKKRPRTACGLASSSSKTMPPTSSRQAAVALVTPLDHSAAAAEAPRRFARRLTPTAKKVLADSVTDDLPTTTAVKTRARGGGGGASAQRLPAGSFRGIAWGSGGRAKHSSAEGSSGGSRARLRRPTDDIERKEEEEEEEAEWMSPQRCLDLAPVPVAVKKKEQQRQLRKSRPSREKNGYDYGQPWPSKGRREVGRSADEGRALDKTEWDPSDNDGDDSDVGQTSRRPQQATPPQDKNNTQARVLTRGRATGSRTSSQHQQDRPLPGGAESRPEDNRAANRTEEGTSHHAHLSRSGEEDGDAGQRGAAATVTPKPQTRGAGGLCVEAGTTPPPRAGKKCGATVVASNHVVEGVAGTTERTGEDKDISNISDISDPALTGHSSIDEGDGGGIAAAVTGSSSSRGGHRGSERKRGARPPLSPPSRQPQRQRQQEKRRGADDNAEEGRDRDCRSGGGGGDGGGGGGGGLTDRGAGDEFGEEVCRSQGGEENGERGMGMDDLEDLEDLEEDEDVEDGGEDDIEWAKGDDEGQDQVGGGEEWEDEDDEEEDDDYALVKVTRMLQQFVADAQEKDRQLKKRKVDTALEDARGLSLGYIDQVSMQVTGHWKSLVDDLMERGRNAEEGVAAAEEAVASLTVQQEAQWQSARDRVYKHESALKRLEALLGASAGASSSASISELEREWQAGGASIQLKLQSHREGAVSRFSAWLTDSSKKAKRSPGGGGVGGKGDIASLLGHLGAR